MKNEMISAVVGGSMFFSLGIFSADTVDTTKTVRVMTTLPDTAPPKGKTIPMGQFLKMKILDTNKMNGVVNGILCDNFNYDGKNVFSAWQVTAKGFIENGKRTKWILNVPTKAGMKDIEVNAVPLRKTNGIDNGGYFDGNAEIGTEFMLFTKGETVLPFGVL